MSNNAISTGPELPDNPAESTVDDSRLLANRDLSWLRFLSRVRLQSSDTRHPLLDRVRFAGIATAILDEFFMKRIALMLERLEEGRVTASLDGLSIQEVLERSTELIKQEQVELDRIWFEELVPSLKTHGVVVLEYGELPPTDRLRVDQWFERQVEPVLTPLAVDEGHPFPFISNLSTSLGVLLRVPGERTKQFARIKLPDGLPRMVPVPHSGPVGITQDPNRIRFIPLWQLVEANLGALFPEMEILDSGLFRLTRGAGLETGEDDDDEPDLMSTVETELARRRFAGPVRLEMEPESSPELQSLLLDELGLPKDAVTVRTSPFEPAAYHQLADLPRADLQRKKWIPTAPLRLRGNSDIFSTIRDGDLFVHHPYESFHDSVERFVNDAAHDDKVVAIKQTLYRTTSDSPFIESLIHAAEAGKQVACLVELRARFDERNNVGLARVLEKHGVHVAYGVVGLKTHCKLSLVIRREGDGLRRYAHVGTGNYHPGTAQLYTDCGILSCDPRLTEDVADVFNFLTGRSRKKKFNDILLAPQTMKATFLRLINEEAEHATNGRPARIWGKMNQLEDPEIIQALYRASRAGVQIQLIVRGFCLLRPGVPGLSDNITIVSVIGRFLEHSRIFHFSGGKSAPSQGMWYLGSADWMRRNLENRVEVVTPIRDKSCINRMQEIMEVGLSDARNAHLILPDGNSEPISNIDSPIVKEAVNKGTFGTLCDRAQRVLESSPQPQLLTRPPRRTKVSGATKPQSKSTKTWDDATARVTRVMLSLPWLDQRELALTTGHSPREMTNLQRKAEARGWIRVHRIGRSVVWDVRPAAAKDLTARTTVVPGRGAFDKRWLQMRLQAWLEAGNAEVRRGSKIADPLEAVLPDGTLCRWLILPSRRMMTSMAKQDAESNGNSIVVERTRADAKRTQSRTGIQALSTIEFIKGTPPTLLGGHSV
ncbi:MAG: polyphosphate kinase 1 [Phycisphaera sp. TMED24]|nr:MAG: polyphosphate kinase 1 [Phycisphaera sp. TMED24]